MTEREKMLTDDPKEKEVRAILQGRADAADAALKDLPASADAPRPPLEKKLAEAEGAPTPRRTWSSRPRTALDEFPADADAAKAAWTTVDGPRTSRRNAAAAPHASRSPGNDRGGAEHRARNFLGIVFCMMFGTAALPHILMRYYTTPSVRAGAQFGVLVAVLHLPAVFHRARAGGAGEIRRLYAAGGQQRSRSCRHGRRLGDWSIQRC